jgi:hypothetical protein
MLNQMVFCLIINFIECAGKMKININWLEKQVSGKSLRILILKRKLKE